MRFFQQAKNIYHLLQAVGANLVFGFPSRKIKVIGVTGTNGKTTTVWMINKILEEAGFKTAVSSTINFKIGEKEWVNKTKFTTLSAWKIQKFIKEAVAAGCEYLILETSSHALDQNRVWGIDYDMVIVTNITREHLDYHQTMEEYKESKKKLFRLTQNSKVKTQNCNLKLKTKKTIIVNLGMQWAEEFLEAKADEKWAYKLKIQNSKVKSQNYSSKLKTVIAENVKLNSKGSEFMVSAQGGPVSGWQNFKLNLPGEFNIENALAAICVGLSQNIKLETCAKALEKIKKIPGRMDYVENNKGLKIIIDYAVTPDSMEKLGQLISKIKKPENKLIWVFGACGERDRGKRPMMGAIGAKYADVAIITNEDPYGENPESIVDEIMAGTQEDARNKMQDTNKFSGYAGSGEARQNSKLKTETENANANAKTEGVNCLKILNRREAIKKALEIARVGDIVLITGKGAEETMAIGKKRIPWNDRKVVEELLKDT